ncbi:hypothetical protein ACA910_019010 [Epithemia clementina (nom. ined.)]
MKHITLPKLSLESYYAKVTLKTLLAEEWRKYHCGCRIICVAWIDLRILAHESNQQDAIIWQVLCCGNFGPWCSEPWVGCRMDELTILAATAVTW